MKESTEAIGKAVMPAVYIVIGAAIPIIGYMIGAFKSAEPAQFWPAASALGTFAGSLVTGVSVAIAAWSFRSQARQNTISLATDMLIKLTNEFDGERMQTARSRAAEFLGTASGQTNSSVDSVLDFFEQVALLERRGAIDIEFVWHAFYNWLFHYYHLTRDYRAAASAHDSAVWADLNRLYERMVTEQGKAVKHVGGAPTAEQLHEFVESEVALLERSA